MWEALQYARFVFITSIIRDYFKNLTCYKYPDHANSKLKVSKNKTVLEPQFRHPLTCKIVYVYGVYHQFQL